MLRVNTLGKMCNSTAINRRSVTLPLATPFGGAQNERFISSVKRSKGLVTAPSCQPRRFPPPTVSFAYERPLKINYTARKAVVSYNPKQKANAEAVEDEKKVFMLTELAVQNQNNSRIVSGLRKHLLSSQIQGRKADESRIY